MGKAISKLFFWIGYALGFIIRINFSNKIRTFRNYFYSGFLKPSFKKCGSGFYAEYPLRIIGSEYISIGKSFSSYPNTRIEVFNTENAVLINKPELTIGDNVNIIYDCHLGCINKVIIGNNVLIASKVFITDHYHGEIDAVAIMSPPAKREIYSKGAVIIEDNVWIGEGVAIMPNVTIGKNSIIGANAVVTKSFPPNSVIGGVPARLLKTLNL
ncbi:transferase hexapeptide (six repeat-containing protein) [Mucilaginibacter sp. OK268]|jgi:acetyltransferase-like isoleucine patch superfamily enzyme|uniref:DapH/DapD/GlmU-related protein n=1 Tax=Mucilaginibacter sp. OK268 TaxID=1881048 RepID=UPI00088DD0B6|nr:DapH/DapD/GlmU-related protein [Mucilaginibacter sp. OK268]SDP56875.1 transferase hexapeptide (six repeat-containing protein) [Mucilaginibacter sp. OK268]